MSSLPPGIFFVNGDINYPPTGPVFIGADPTNPNSAAGPSLLTTLQTQLYIDDTMTKREFDARVVADPNYPTIIHLLNLRILVIVPKYNDGYADGYFDGYSDGYSDGYINGQTSIPCYHPHIVVSNVNLADVVMFVHQGLVDIEKNRFGPPGQNYDIQRMNMYAMLRAAHSHNVITVPMWGGPKCNECDYPFFCDRCHTFSGIKICRGCGCGCMCGCNTGLIDNQGIRSSIIHAPNCSNEYHNRNFIDRK